MPDELLAEARARAGRAPLAVRGAALLHIARVLTTHDRTEADRTLTDALAAIDTLPEDEREILRGEAAGLAATVSPARAFEIAETLTFERASVIEMMLFRMSDHGFRREAAAYLKESGIGTEFPFSAVTPTIGQSDDDEERRAVLRKSIQAMRERNPDPTRRSFRRRQFVETFTYFWPSLPSEEARAAIRDLIDGILAEPDGATRASFGAGSHQVRFSSTHDGDLFGILGPLRHLDPELAGFVVQRSRDLSAAAAKYPYGMESMTEAMTAEQAPPSAEQIAAACIDGISVGSRFIPISEAIRTEFAEAFDIALDHYDADIDPMRPNLVPQQCWPSAADFRNILYKAGVHEGAVAAKYLDRIPDPALRLFAQIELAAALAGLPQLGSRTMSTGRGSLRDIVRPQPQPPRGDLPANVPFLRALSTEKPRVSPSRQPHIVPAAAPVAEGPTGGNGSDFIDVRNASLKGMLSQLHEMPASRIEWASSVDANARFDFALVLPRPEPRTTMVGLLRDGIAAHFHLRVSVEDRVGEAWVLTAPNGIKARVLRTGAGTEGFAHFSISTSSFDISLDASAPVPEGMRLDQILGRQFDPSQVGPDRMFAEMRGQTTRHMAAMMSSGSFSGLNASLSIGDLCTIVEAGLDRPLVDETGLTGLYVINVETNASSAGEFLPVLAGRLGLVLSSAERTVPTLVIG
jgi:uncharacterized protein (TIGR03435 family)